MNVNTDCVPSSAAERASFAETSLTIRLDEEFDYAIASGVSNLKLSGVTQYKRTSEHAAATGAADTMQQSAEAGSQV